MPDTLNPENKTQDLDKESKKQVTLNDSPPIPAATLVLLREGPGDIEVLMLKKNPKIGFGGMWVFPGGRIDAEDHSTESTENTHCPTSGPSQAARIAAARETKEEANLDTDPNSYLWFAQWSPPPLPGKRFTTSFFVSPAPEQQLITVDGGEIHDHQWVTPKEAIHLRDQKQLNLAPPTWVTLHTLSQFSKIPSLLTHLKSRPPRIYETHASQNKNGDRVVLWKGDAGYDAWDASIEGSRHRLTLNSDKYLFENSDDF